MSCCALTTSLRRAAICRNEYGITLPGPTTPTSPPRLGPNPERGRRCSKCVYHTKSSICNDISSGLCSEGSAHGGRAAEGDPAAGDASWAGEWRATRRVVAAWRGPPLVRGPCALGVPRSAQGKVATQALDVQAAPTEVGRGRRERRGRRARRHSSNRSITHRRSGAAAAAAAHRDEGPGARLQRN